MCRVNVARCHISSKDVPSTVMLMHAKSGRVLLKENISGWADKCEVPWVDNKI